jgi:hypothetical protein
MSIMRFRMVVDMRTIIIRGLTEQFSDAADDVNSEWTSYGDLGCALASKYHGTPVQSDARAAAFAKITCLLMCVTLSLRSIAVLLRSGSWKKLVADAPHQEGLEAIATLDLHQRFACLHGLYSNVDSSIRLFLRHFVPTFGKGASVAYSKVYRKFCNTFALDDDDEKLFELLGLYRNTVHNNGVHIAYGGIEALKNQTIVYGGATHVFNENTFVQVDWPVVLLLLRHIRDMWQRVVGLRMVEEEDFILDHAPQTSGPAGPYLL